MWTMGDYLELRAAAEGVLQDLGVFLGDLTGHTLGEPCGGRELIDGQLEHFWDVYYRMRKRHEDQALTVAVLALTKSGKSTLLNALMGSECLPVNNVPETARICKIIHQTSDGADLPVMLEGDTEVSGAGAIRQRLQQLNRKVRTHEQSRADESVLCIKTSIACVQNLRQNDQSTCLHLLDTPGPNEAGEEGLRFQVERLLDDVDAVIYLLDYTKLKTAEEAEIFRRLKQINPQLISRLSQRLFFAVNKADELFSCEGMDEEETRAYVSELVTRQLATEGFQLMPEQVILLSARDALTARLVASHQACPATMQRFRRLAFGYSKAKQRSEQETQQACQMMLDNSGILELEERVLNYLYSHRGSVKLMATVDDIGRLLQGIHNVAISCQAALHQNAESIRMQLESLEHEVANTMSEFDEVDKQTEVLEGEVTDELRAQLSNLRIRLFNNIVQTLDTGITATVQTPSTAWARVRNKVLGLFGQGASSRLKDELCDKLIEVHDDIMAQIHEEVGQFWHMLEASTSARHRLLLRHLNDIISRLSSRIEEAVESRLDVTLEPIKLEMVMPSMQEFHSDLTELINKGISQREEKHVRVGQRVVHNRERRHRHGICHWGSYWVSVPRTRTVVETINTTVYRLEPQAILDHFILMIDAALSITERSLAAHVKAFIRRQQDQAKEKVAEYGQRYLNSMQAAAAAGCQGQRSRESALQQIEDHLSTLELMRSRVRSLLSAVELLVPHVCGAGMFEQVNYRDEVHSSDNEEGETEDLFKSFIDFTSKVPDEENMERSNTEADNSESCEAALEAKPEHVYLESDCRIKDQDDKMILVDPTQHRTDGHSLVESMLKSAATREECEDASRDVELDSSNEKIAVDEENLNETGKGWKSASSSAHHDVAVLSKSERSDDAKAPGGECMLQMERLPEKVATTLYNGGDHLQDDQPLLPVGDAHQSEALLSKPSVEKTALEAVDGDEARSFSSASSGHESLADNLLNTQLPVSDSLLHSAEDGEGNNDNSYTSVPVGGSGPIPSSPRSNHAEDGPTSVEEGSNAGEALEDWTMLSNE